MNRTNYGTYRLKRKKHERSVGLHGGEGAQLVFFLSLKQKSGQVFDPSRFCRPPRKFIGKLREFLLREQPTDCVILYFDPTKS